MQITIIGTGFVGVVSAAVYASLGHQVIGLDIDPKKVKSLQNSKVPFFEPNLENLLIEQQAKERLTFTTDYQQAIEHAEIVIIAVGTPSAPDGQADLTYVLASAKSLAPHLQQNAIVIVKSTVPPGTLDKVKQVMDPLTQVDYHLASLPEFLREGKAVHDTLNPDRVVIGAEDEQVFDKLEQLHRPLNAPIIRVSPESAQMAKYTANAYLATRITFINQIADLCSKNGANIMEVIQAIGFDQRIGDHYWYPGFGYGGSCFPKDVKELAAYSRAIGEGGNLLNKVSDLNQERIPKLMNDYADAIGGWENKTVAILGLSFKPQTDDMREAPSIRVSQYLAKFDSKIKGFDPKALEIAPHFLPKSKNISLHDTIEQACQKADVIIALIEWPEIVTFDFSKVKTTDKQWFIDARNQFDPEQIKDWGFNYLAVGQG